MRKLFFFFISVFVLTSCTTILRNRDDGCPAFSKDQLDEKGYLMLQDGITLKCHVKRSTSRMSCAAITDEKGADGWLCANGAQKALFIFDKNEVLKSHKIF